MFYGRCILYDGLDNLYSEEWDMVDWFSLSWIFGMIAIIIWIIVAAKIEGDRMNADNDRRNADKKNKR